MMMLDNIFKGMEFGHKLKTRSGRMAFFIRQSAYFYLVKVDGIKDDIQLYCNGRYNQSSDNPNDIIEVF